MRPGIIEVSNNMDDLTRGMATQPQQAQDEYYDKEVRFFLSNSSPTYCVKSTVWIRKNQFQEVTKISGS